MIQLEIPRATPSMNATHHKHWRVMYAQKKLWEQEIWAAGVQARECAIYLVPIRSKVTIERYGRMLDADNFVGGLKSVIDGLKSNGFIVDDAPEHLELVATQHKGTPRTVIRIEAA
jgi:hypothetical protein